MIKIKKHKWYEYLNPIFLITIIIAFPIAMIILLCEKIGGHAKKLFDDLFKIE